jgi:phosphoenolpyruvate carboxykinase (ATP)
MPIKATRALLTAALDGSLNGGGIPQGSEFRLRGAGVGARRAEVLLDPRGPGTIRTPMTPRREKLVKMFADNFEQYVPYIDEDVKAAAIG